MRQLLSTALILICAFTGTAQPRLVSQNLLGKETPAFLKNKGQVTDQNGKLRPDVKFIYDSKGYKLILRETGFSHEFYWYEKKPKPVSEAKGKTLESALPSKFREPDDYTVHISRIDVELK